MNTSGLPTFQQTFANCPFPEGVLAALGGFPARVRVFRADRAMEVELLGAAADREALVQASDCIKETLRLNRVTVASGPSEPKPAPDAQTAQKRQ